MGGRVSLCRSYRRADRAIGAQQRSSRLCYGSDMAKSPFDRLDPFDRDRKLWRVVVETPCGSGAKYKFEPDLGLFVLGTTLPDGMSFPLDFGFLPGTVGDDGDPVDVLLLS